MGTSPSSYIQVPPPPPDSDLDQAGSALQHYSVTAPMDHIQSGGGEEFSLIKGERKNWEESKFIGENLFF